MKKIFAILMIVMMVVCFMPTMAFGATSQEWQVSKSKEATNLDGNYESKVTLSLPSAEEKLSTDVVFVLDKSKSTEVEEQVLTMLTNLRDKAVDTKAKVNVGIVIFNKQAHRLCELTDLSEESALEKIEAAIKTKISSGTNLHAGIMAGKAMLEADTNTDANRKYLITVSDGITYMFGEQPTAVAWSWYGDSLLNWCGPDNWNSKYGSNEPPENWNTWLDNLAEQVKETTYDYPYSGTIIEATPADKKMDYANSIDKALYFSYQTYMEAKADGYHCYATTANQTSGTQYKWGPSFMNFLADGQTVDFEKIQNEILYLLDAGSVVKDEIGKTGEYDFNLVRPETMTVKVGEKEYRATAKEGDGNTFTFGEANGNGQFPYEVSYFPENAHNSREYLKWQINVPVSNLERTSLTYTIKLSNPKTEAGTYGQYDRDGSQNYNGLYTNNSAVLYPVNSNGISGDQEDFPKPTVSYTVSSTYIPPVTHYYTVTYNDGVEGEEVFPDQINRGLSYYTLTPAFNGIPLREGYEFKGWMPTVAERVTADAYYKAVWEKIEEPVQPTEPEQPAKPDKPNKPLPGDKELANDKTNTGTNVPKTGDTGMDALVLNLLLLSISAMAGTVLYLRRRIAKR